MALEEARQGAAEGGIPIGSTLVLTEPDGSRRVLGRGRNKRVQEQSAIKHGEMDCLENAGCLPAAVYRRCTLYTTLSPCPMCSGAILLYKIPRVVVGENMTFVGAEGLLRERGVEVVVRQDADCVALMADFVRTKPALWAEDIGV
jgi:cytosine/creatinine deaminase